MRKSFFYMLGFALLSFICITSCNKQEAKKISGIVKKVSMDDDTLKDLTLITGQDSMVFSLDNVRFNNGVMLPEDSVTVYYAEGKNDTARAFIVSVHPKVSTIVIPENNENNKLITAPN